MYRLWVMFLVTTMVIFVTSAGSKVIDRRNANPCEDDYASPVGNKARD